MGNGITSSIQTTSIYDPEQLADSSPLWLLGGIKWGGAVGTGVNLTYSFGNIDSSYDSYLDPELDGQEPYYGYAEMNTTQKASSLAAMKSFANVASIVFTQVSDTATSAGDIRWANSTAEMDSYAWAYSPGSNAFNGDIWNNPSNVPDAPNMLYYALAHELGHALGLEHPHAEEGRITSPAPTQFDYSKYTIMSYKDYAGDPDEGIGGSDYYPTTLMMDDIRTVQALYGKNMAYRSGDTTYQWAANSVIFETIWDGGGIDTIDASNQLSGVSINLNPGTFSTIGKAFFNGNATVRDCLGIAYACNIEDAIGSAFSDTLQGNALGNYLAGGAGNDIVRGAAGGDWLYGEEGSDQLWGGSGADLIWGEDGNDKLYGEDGDDKLNGGAGTNTMAGGLGNDTYYVSNTLDVVSESSDALNGGADTVRSSATYTLGNYVENLVLTGSSAVNATGNTLTNKLTGNAGANVLNGGAGADTMAGGLGNDTYYVSNTFDMVSESSDALNGGADTVRSSITYTLGSYVENLALTGSSAVNATGNTLANKLTGNAGANVLNGGAGADTMTGGLGNDIFVFSTSLNAATNVDTIADFARVTGNTDKIYLDDDIFTALGSVTQPSTLGVAAFCAGTAATSASHRIVYDSYTGSVFYDADGVGAGAQVKVALIGLGSSTLSASDFAIVS